MEKSFFDHIIRSIFLRSRKAWFVSKTSSHVIFYCINTNEIPGELLHENMIFSNAKIIIMLSAHVKYHHCYSCMNKLCLLQKKAVLVKWFGISLVFIINRTLHGCLEIQNFSSYVEKIFYLHAALTHETFFNTERTFSYLSAAM